MMSKDEQLIQMGFEKSQLLGRFTYSLGRDRLLLIVCLNTPNEQMWICSLDDEKLIEDFICLHNWDYDGPLIIDKVEQLINLLKYDKKRSNYEKSNVS